MEANLSRPFVALLTAAQKVRMSAVIERRSMLDYSCLISKVEVVYVQKYSHSRVPPLQRPVSGILQAPRK